MAATRSTDPTADTVRSFDLGAWLVLALAVGYIAAVIVYVLLAYRQPTDGWLYSAGLGGNNILVANQSGAPSPLQAGDALQAINGQPVVALLYRPQPPPDSWQLGGSVRYTVLREGDNLELAVPLVTRPAAELLRYTLGVDEGAPWRPLSSLCWYLIGFGVFLLRPRSTAARLLLLTVIYWTTYDAILAADTPATIGFYPPLLFWFRFGTEMLWPMLYAMLTHLVLAFPVRNWPLARWPRATLVALYGAPIVGVLAGVALASDGPTLGSLFLSMVVLVIALLGSMIANLRRAPDPVVRAQIGWMLLGISVPVVSAIGINGFLFLNLMVPGQVPNWIWSAVALALPLGLAIAITRYRLFDIDVIIRRTLVYTLLTLALGAVYFGGVALLQALFVRLTGEESTLAVVASTLAIAALFLPLRAHVQGFIDRRFFRRKFDAQQVLNAFAQRAQQESDVEALSADVLGTVQEALEPEGATLWIVRKT